MFYRDRLDQYLFAQAVAAGAEYRLHTRVHKIAGHRVFTATEEFEGGLIIGADGPNSTVSASFSSFSPNRELIPCAFVIAEGDFSDSRRLAAFRISAPRRRDHAAGAQKLLARAPAHRLHAKKRQLVSRADVAV
jgi:2-polyprenyl-6-methoxyphenol hydroxylase-like FAD-dependent oxidoreductase